MTAARVILRPRRGESPADLCRDLMAITNGTGLTIQSSAGGFLVDDQTALAYLTAAAEPDQPPPAELEPGPALADALPPPPDATDDPTSTTTNPDGDTPAPAKAKRVPRRGAAMKETGHAV